MEDIRYQPIGIIHSPFAETEGMPIQPTGAAAAPGTVVLFPQFAAGLVDLEGFSHLILLYHLHRVKRMQLAVIPFLDDRPNGVFATRAPTRPNPIGMSVVRLVRREQNILHIAHLDIIDGTPLLDIKPYVPAFDAVAGAQAGWLEATDDEAAWARADGRFS